jgi:hypothetical protein
VKKKIIIVGNGLAAWLSAAMISHEIKERKANYFINVIESKKTLPVGVGEGSIPNLVPVLNKLGIDLAAIKATYKLGIEYNNWYSESDSPFNKWYHTFSWEEWIKETPSIVNYDNFFSNIEMASPEEKNKNLMHGNYALHFDTHCLTQELKKKALSFNCCKIILGTVVETKLNEEGIESIKLDGDIVLKGAYYLDCTGFNRVLISNFNPKFIDYSDILPCDSAIATFVAPEKENITFTVATALSAGWMWKIPTTEKTGMGYVYSSKFISEDRATEEFLGVIDNLKNKNSNIKKFSWHPGFLEKPFIKNCFAIGLSSGFLEPMEALSIDLTQNLIQKFFLHLFRGKDNNILNRNITSYTEGAADYLAAHYLLSRRNKSSFWRHCSKDLDTPLGMIKKISDCKHRYLKRRYLWARPKPYHGKDFPWNSNNIFRPHSWIMMLAGMGADR